MAQQVVIAGAVFNDVPYIQCPDANNVLHSFHDVSDTTATATDVLNSKWFYSSSGVKTQGTGSQKNNQIAFGTNRTNRTSMTKLLELTCNKTGTYDLYWSCTRMGTTSGFGAQLYIDDIAYGSLVTNFSNNVHNAVLHGVSLQSGQKAAVYAKSASSSYYIYVPMMVIMEA